MKSRTISHLMGSEYSGCRRFLLFYLLFFLPTQDARREEGNRKWGGEHETETIRQMPWIKYIAMHRVNHQKRTYRLLTSSTSS